MSSLADIRTPLDPDQFYHIYNRGNGGRLIFYAEKNYSYFLEKIREYMSDYWDVYAYCLLPNHFHLMVKIKQEDVLIKMGGIEFKKISAGFLNKYGLTDMAEKSPDLLNFQNLVNLDQQSYRDYFFKGDAVVFRRELIQWMVSEKFRRFLLSYAKSINRQEDLSGSLFQKLFRRKQVLEFKYLYNLILYIHRNPIHHERALDMMGWFWSSYPSYLSVKKTALKRETVLGWFDGLDNFIKVHESKTEDWYNGRNYIIED
jgi:REP element-mobilizing transposase RayT